jgi:hypothetical protein
VRAVARATTLAEVNVIKQHHNQKICRHLWAAMPAGDGLFLAIGQLKATAKGVFSCYHKMINHNYRIRVIDYFDPSRKTATRVSKDYITQ